MPPSGSLQCTLQKKEILMMTILNKREGALIFLLFLGCIFPSVLPGQIALPEALTIDDGLSQGMVYDLLQTKDGFLWVGTKDGLNRYDGYNFRVWDNDPGQPFTLSDNTVTALFEDSRGWLWVGCETRGVNIMDRRKERFYHISLPVTLTGNKEVLYDVRCIREDKNGNIWVVNRGGGIFRLNIPKTWNNTLPETPNLGNQITVVPIPIPSVKTSTTSLQEEFLSVCEIQDGSIWVGSTKGLYKIDPPFIAAQKIQTPVHFPIESGNIVQTSTGEIWGTSRDGVFKFKNGEFKRYTLGLGQEVGTLPTLQVDKAGGIWILFETKLWYVTPNKMPDPLHPDYIIDKPANALTLDAQGNVWVGTLGYGLRKITPRKSKFYTNLPGTSIWGVWQDGQGKILCKLFNKIVAYDPVTRRLSGQSAFPDALPQQNDLIFEPGGDIWLLCGLREGNVNQSQLRHYRPDRSLAAVFNITLDRYPYARLLRTSDGCIWASGTSGRLLRCNPATGEITGFDFGWLFGKQEPAVLTFALVEDGNGTIWAGTQMGLVKGVWKNGTMDFQLLSTSAEAPTALNNNSIACLLPDPRAPGKRLWIGTKGGGINGLDLQTGQVSYITTADGLPNNVVYGILTDSSGHLWCSTNRGLVRLALRDETVVGVKLFTVADGLQSNEFNTQAFFKAQNGEMLFGGVNGLNRFLPQSLELNTQAPPVFITGLEINHQPEHFSAANNQLTAPLEYLDKITLDAYQNNLSFEFAALDFTAPAKNRYRYQLMPLEKNWVEAGKSHFAHYTHLAPGNYIFQVQGSNSDGAWNETPVEIEIAIRPPWWRSRIARFIYSCIVAVIIWQIYLVQTSRIRLQEQVAFEHRESTRIRELEQMKTNFFSNITHEFRTPLTLIIEPLRQVLHNPAAGNWLAKVQLAAHNSQKLLNLVNELLDLAKLDSGAMQPEYRMGLLGDILRPVVESFAGAAASKDIHMQLSIPEQDIHGAFDRDKIEKICFNLISNALKFTPPGGSIQVLAALVKDTDEAPLIQENTGAGVLITVKDNGQGIAAADLPHIFDRFYQANETPSQGQIGTGIGLALCRELAERMGGKIAARSQPGQGSDFQLWLPHVHGVFDQVEKTAGHVQVALPEKTERPEIISNACVSARDHQQDAGGRPLLLLAEDNDELRAFLFQTLSDTYDVIEAPDGKQALELARQQVPDIVVSDIFMPHLDGIGLLDVLKNDVLTSHIPVLLLTSKMALASRLEGLRHGADAYLSKPFQTEELFAWLSNLLETRRRLQEKYIHHIPVNKTETPNRSDSLDVGVPSPGTAMGVLDRQFLEKLQQVAEQEIENENLSVEDLARHMAMSRSQLHRKLCAITGQSASAFLRNYRLDKAMELLQARAGNVSEVAWRVGFSNPKYFSTSFKDRFGFSPSEV